MSDAPPNAPDRARPVVRAASALLAAALLPSVSSAADVDFSRDVLPILSAHCLACHGPDATKRKADLRLDTRDGALAERDGQPAVVPGQPARSELIARVAADDADGRMPPPKAGPRLSA